MDTQGMTRFLLPLRIESKRLSPIHIATMPSGECRLAYAMHLPYATFQRCMMAIFTDIVEDIMEVFMDDFSMVRDSFDDCLINLRRMLKRYMETNLVLNWKSAILWVAFEELKNGIDIAPIIIAPVWEQSFELICDASDYVVGVIFGQRKDKVIHRVYYASRTLSGAQLNYIITEKEILTLPDRLKDRLEGVEKKVEVDEIVETFPDE
ncbi:uncharacterized protein [Nicotiana tomentosiformis]|uniref:uncharacterized protein n=1 Tax=Nicotiana tomentosiformis TaxID=4098 RepID=UPI00388C907C